ncbi:hypothetical protein JCM6882_009654 [Rhodosporidiobolus microsporus]
MDDIAELQGFVPRPSTSKQPSSFDIDPALAGPGPSSSAARSRRQSGPGDYWDDDDEEEGYYSGEPDEGDEDNSDEDETDAEEEFAATQRDGGAAGKPARKSVGGIVTGDGTVIPAASLKGKERAVDQDGLFGFEDDDTSPEDLTRLITAVRDSNTGFGGAAALEREFDRSIAYELDGFDPDLIEDMSVGIKGRKRRRGQGRGGRRAAADVEPSPEVKRLLSQAAEAYSQGRLLEAIEQLSEVVRIDPIIRSSWYTLATIYEELEDREKALQCKIVATHLMGAKRAAADWVELGRDSRDLGLLHQAIYCFTQAVKANKEDVDAMWDRAILLKLSGATTMAIRAFLALLSLLPHDPGVLRELAPLLAQTEQYTQATTLLLSAFAHYRHLVPLVSPFNVDHLQTYGYGDLETLADFLLLQRNWAEAVRVVRQGVRWLQGREKETGWDTMEDDREYDEERKIREGWEKGNTWFELEPTYELDVRLRSRLGLARLGMSWVPEAQRHFEYVLAEDVAQFPELFGAIGDAYYERAMYEAALDVFQLIAENEETNGPAAWFKIAQCHQATGDLEEAKECYENVVAEEPENIEAKLALAKVLEHLNEPARALQLIKDVITIREAQAVPEDGSEGGARRRRSTWASREERAARRANREDAERARHAEFQMAFSRLDGLEARVQAGEDDAIQQWIEVATGLVDSFRSTRQLFPQDFKKKFVGMLGRPVGRPSGSGKKKERDIDADADQMADRLERTLDADEAEEPVEETSFRGLDFDQWVDFILKYCFLLVRCEDVESAAEVLLHVREASVMRQSQSRTEALRLGLIACYHHAGMYAQVLKEYRWFFLAHTNQTEPLRLFLSLLSSSQAAIEALNDNRLQKYVLRVLKSIQGHANGSGGGKGSAADEDGSRSTSPVASRKGPASSQAKGGASGPQDGESDEDDGEEGDEPGETSSFKPTKLNPMWYTLYGCMLNISQSHQGSIIYLLRAYDLDKKQPLINLAIASAYLQRAMSRKTDNRQHQIAQAFAFIDQYRRLRGPGQESEYNLARAFHHLGIQGHAVKHYENVLRFPVNSPSPSANTSDRMAVDGEPAPPPSSTTSDKYAYVDYRKVAAYNLMTLYAMSNLPELARGVAERWLAV